MIPEIASTSDDDDLVFDALEGAIRNLEASHSVRTRRGSRGTQARKAFGIVRKH
jgi:hypothetical protein